MLMPAFLLALSMSSPMPAISLIAPGVMTPVMAIEEVNDACPVCGAVIAPGKGTKVLVRGHEYTVDDPACGEKLTASPDDYLEADGTPKNAKKETKPS